MKKKVIAIVLSIALASSNLITMPVYATDNNGQEQDTEIERESNLSQEPAFEADQESEETQAEEDHLAAPDDSNDGKAEDTTEDENVPSKKQQEASNHEAPPIEGSTDSATIVSTTPEQSEQTEDGEQGVDRSEESEITVTESAEEADTEAVENKALGDTILSGTTDSGVAYVLDSEGTLTISGSDDMGYWITESPWSDYREQIKSVVIKEGVTSIHPGAFEECANLVSVSIPNSVTFIGDYAFGWCPNLESVTIPTDLEKLGDGAFCSCFSLKTVIVPRAQIVEDGVFSNCTSLTNAVIMDGVTVINRSLFSGCSALQSVTIPDSVTSIEGSAFEYCASLQNVEIPSGVTSIECCAFMGCKSLKNVVIPNAVDMIEHSLFSDCSGLESITLSSNTMSIDSYAFAGCTSLKSIVIPGNVETIGEEAFNGCTALKSICIPDKVKTIGEKAFEGCTLLESAEISDSLTEIAGYTFEGCISLKSIIIPNSVAGIGNYAFKGCTSLTNASIGSSVTSIGEYAFYGCSSLSGIEVPDNVTSMGEYAFFECIELKNAVIGKGLTNIVKHAFENCTSMASLTMESSVTSIDEYAFSGCNSLESVEIPDSVTSIGNYAFNGCTGLEDVSLGSGVTSIGNCAFYYCSKLGSIEILPSVTSIGWNAFSYCGLTDLVIGDSVEQIGSEAFKGCTNLKSVVIGDSLTSHNGIDFTELKYLENLVIGDRVENLNFYDFSKCVNLKNVVIGDGIEEIKSGQFKNLTKLESITLGENVDSIGYMAFDGCTGLKNVTLNEALTTIGRYSFSNCTSLEIIEIPDSVDIIDDCAFKGCSNLVSVSLGEGVTSLGANIFDNCTALTKIVIPDGVESIGTSAFLGCTSLKSVTMPRYLECIAKLTFENCENLESIIIPEGVEYIGDWAFENCKKLKSVTIPDGVDSIRDYAFKECDQLERVYLPETLETIGSNAFYGCENLTEVVLPEGLTNIGYSAFQSCKGLTVLIIPDSVLSIGDMAFYNCEGLTKLEMGENVETIGTKAFVGCPKLSEATIPSTITSLGVGPFEQGCTIYYQSTLENWKSVSGYMKVHLSPTGSYYGYGTNIYFGDDDVLAVHINPDEVTLQTWHTYTLEATRANAILESDSPKWTIDREQSDGSISILSSYVREGKAYCLIIATGVGTCNINVKVNGSYSAKAAIHIEDEEKPVTAITAVSGVASHLSGSQNYELENTSSGVFNWSDPITSMIVMKGGSKYTADHTIIIKKNGELITAGILEAKKIEVKSDGILYCQGQVNADEVIVNGGWLRVTSDLRVKKLTIKGNGRLELESGAQIVVKESFVYKGKEVTKLRGNLFIGGSMDVNRHFSASGSSDGTLNTIFYGNTSNRVFSFHPKSQIGNVFVENKDSFDHIGIPSDNLVGAMLFTNLEDPNYKKWTFRPDTKTGKLVVGWEGTLGVYYQNMQKAMQGAFTLDSYNGLTQDECRFVEELAVDWTSTLYPQINTGFIDVSTQKYELHFEIRGTEYKLKYEPLTIGSYGKFGTVKFGLVDDDEPKIIGGLAGGSEENFRAQMTTYLSEEFVSEYFKFVFGNLPKTATDSSVIGKLKRMGKKGAIKGLEKILDKYLFGALQTPYVGDGFSWIEKSFKITNMIVDGDVVGLWKFAFETSNSTTKSTSGKSALFGTGAVPINNEIEEIVVNEKDRMLTGLEDLSITNAAREDVSDTVTDEFLKAALVERLGADSEGEPDWTRQSDVTFLDLSGKYIESLDGIQNFTNLSTLILEGNEISDITALESMTSIKYLDISGQNIDDLSAISNMTGMLELDVSDNPITSIEAVRGMTQLRRLEMKETNIESLSPLTSLKDLQYLDADIVELSDTSLSYLSGLNKLKEVKLEGCGLDSLEGLNVTSLVTLNICDNMIQDMTPLMSAASLETLDLSENMLETLPSLAGCTALKTLDLSGNMLLEVSGLADAPGLRDLNVSACELLDTDMGTLAQVSTLTSLNIANNKIEDMSPLFVLHGLKTLDISGTWIDIADYSDLPRYINYIDTYIVESGTCADYKKWMVDRTGELTIYGTGKMQSYENVSIPWPEANTVRIGEGITRVGDYSFDKQTALVSVQLPSTLKAIGTQAFKGCTALNNLFIPYSVTEIGNEAFSSESLIIYYAGSQEEWNALEKDRNLVYQKVVCNRINLPDSISLSQTSFEYTGEAHEPTVAIVDGDRTLIAGRDYTVTYLNNIRKGKATVRITGIGRYAGTVDKYFNIGNMSIENAVVSSISNAIYTGKEIKPVPVVNRDGVELIEGKDYTLSYTNNMNAGTASVIIDGTGNYTGSITKTFTIKKAANTITAKSFTKTYSTKAQSWSLGVKIKNGTPTYKSSTKSVTVSKAGKATVKAKFIGKATITITAPEKTNYSKMTKKIAITVNPTKTALSSVKSPLTGKMTVKWKKNAVGTGYQIQYSTSGKFTSPKTVTVTKNSTLTKTIGGLAKGKKYYVRIRTYKTVGNAKFYSGWSVAKSVTIKKK